MAQKAIGKVTHYFDKLGVAVIALDKGKTVKKGDKLQFKGHTTDFSQVVSSLQVDHQEVEAVKAGDDFGIKVDKPVREGDPVYTPEK